MKNIILKSALLLALGIAPGAGFAQTEVPKTKPSQQSDGQTPALGSKEHGTTQDHGKGQSGEQTEGRAQAPSEQDPGTSTEQKAQDSTGTSLIKPAEQANQDNKPVPNKSMSKQGTASKTEQPGTTAKEGAAKTSTPASGEDTTKSSNKQLTNETTSSVNVTSEQKTEIKNVITETKAAPVRDVHFKVNVGVAVPRTIDLQPLPPRIVKLVPRYEGYRYFVLADGRIVIVDPGSLEIVVIIA